MTPALETSAGTSATGCRFVAYSGGAWIAVAEEDENGWWRIWLVPPRNAARRPLWGRCQYSEGYACGVAEHIARALVVMAGEAGVGR